MLTLNSSIPGHAQHLHHESLPIDFSEGFNKLNFYFIGGIGNLSIDNVVITNPPKSVNLLVNGDFELPSLAPAKDAVFNDKVPGWTASRIVIGTDDSKSQVLLLTSLSRSICQTVSFGKTNKYSFLSSINTAIQNEAMALISKNLEMFKLNSPGSFSQNYSTVSSSVWATNSASANNNYQSLMNKSTTLTPLMTSAIVGSAVGTNLANLNVPNIYSQQIKQYLTQNPSAVPLP